MWQLLPAPVLSCKNPSFMRYVKRENAKAQDNNPLENYYPTHEKLVLAFLFWSSGFGIFLFRNKKID